VAELAASATSPSALDGGITIVASALSAPAIGSQRGTVRARHRATASTSDPSATSSAPPIGTASIRAVSSLTWSISRVATAGSSDPSGARLGQNGRRCNRHDKPSWQALVGWRRPYERRGRLSSAPAPVFGSVLARIHTRSGRT
jgi:hypothetical protein